MAEKFDSDAEPSIGWLEALVSVAKHRYYQVAAEELGIHSVNVERRIEKLQTWSHRIFLLGGVPLVLNDDEAPFITQAEDALDSFSSAVSSVRQEQGLTSANPRSISTIRVQDLEGLISVEATGRWNYEDAAKALTIARKPPVPYIDSDVRRAVAKLGKIIGVKLIEGRGNIALSPAGHVIVKSAKVIVSLLRSSRHVIPEDYDPAKAFFRRLQRRLYNERMCATASIEMCSDTTDLSDGARKIQEEAAKRLYALNVALAELQEHLGPIESLAVPDLELP